MRFYLLPFLFICLLILAAVPVVAQDSPQNSEVTESDNPNVVRKLRFTGNRNVSDGVLKRLVRTRTNREFLGIPRFTPWYYIHQVFGVGEAPATLSREVVANDMERISIYYENIGFFETTVDTTIVEYRENRYEVSFIIDEGPLSEINSVSYTGIPDFPVPDLKERFYSESRFEDDMLNDSTFIVNEPYRAQLLREEQTRIIDFLKNNGFASVQRDSVRALIKRDSDTPTQMDILFTLNPGRIYTFGDVFIQLDGPEGENNYQDSLVVDDSLRTMDNHKIVMQKQSSAQAKFSLLTDQIRFTPGDTFDQSAYLRSVNSYQNLGMMIINRFGLSEESSLPDYSNTEIPVYFDLQTIPRHSIRTEFFGMRRYGFGTGIGVNYSNNNTFGRAENFTVGLNTNLEYVTSATLNEIAPRDSLGNRVSSGSTIFQSYEVRAEYSLPRLIFPISSLNQNPAIESARTQYSLAYSQSNQLFFDINSDVRFNLRYDINHTSGLRSLIDVIELDIVDTDPSSQFRQNLINEFGEDSFEFRRIEEDFRPQFSSILRYTLRNVNTNLVKRNSGSFGEYSIAFAGNIPHAIDRFLVTPGEIEQSLPSPVGISSNSLAYSRFIKLTADYRRYIPISPDGVFAYRLFGGIAQPYGGSDNIPLNRRFFAGGSNDIRGYSPFRLGPGNIAPEDVTTAGGEIKLAAFTELRQIVLKDALSADWHVAWHTDAGNIWYGPQNTFRDEENVNILEEGKFFFNSFYKQIPVTTGIGLRFDWDFIVARFDFSFRAHDLEAGWFQNRQMYFSFGIGHSF